MNKLLTIVAPGLALGLALMWGTASANPQMIMKKAHESTSAPPSETIKVEKATGPGAYTVAEIHAKSAQLDKKKVTVRGKVVKVSEFIMKRNWIHLRDGSGDTGTRTNNLVVTSQDAPNVGDVVTASGTLAKDRDFGSGYLYSVIVEDATIKK